MISILSLTKGLSFSHGVPFLLSRRTFLSLTENTEEQNTQHFTETLSQPISQNLTANVS